MTAAPPAPPETAKRGANDVHEALCEPPVRDLGRSIEFFTTLGYSFDPRFTDNKAGCLVLGDDIYAMLLVEEFFRTFTHKDIADTSTSAEAITALGVESRERVDQLVDKALSAGGHHANGPDDQGFMYSRGFFDPDGHMWEVISFDASAPPD